MAISAQAPHFLAGGGETGALLRALDWSTSPLGPPEGWPQSLRTAVSIVLGSPNALQLFWGSDLVLIYNDGGRPMMGAKHPATLAQPALDHWPEVREILGPILRDVIATGVATSTTNGLIPTRRNGFLEELYFSWSYSPVRVESGEVGAVFQVAVETTDQVLAERRQRVLRALAALPTSGKGADELCSAALAQLLAQDVPFALVYLVDDDDPQRARLAATVGVIAGTAQSPISIDLSRDGAASPWPLTDVRTSGEPQVVDALEERFGVQQACGWIEAPERALILPLAVAQDSLGGFLVVGLSAGLALDARYRGFLNLVAGQIAAAVAQVRAGETAEENARMVAALQHIDELRREDLTLLFEKAPVGMALMRGPNHIYEFANDEFMALAGQRQIIGKPVRDAFPEFANNGFYEAVDRVYQSGESITAQEMAASKFDARRGLPLDCFLTFTHAPFRTSDGEIDGVVVVVDDVTAAVRTRKQLEAATAQLGIADRRKDEFLAMLGHELRNPLAPIATAVELMKQRGGGDWTRERDVIERQVQHLSRLVGDLFDVSRIVRGKVDLDLQLLEIASVVEKAIEMASPLFDMRRQHLFVDVEAGLLVDGDAGRLAQVLANLLTNASKFTPTDGHIWVAATREAHEVAIHVKDDGMGIESALLPDVFEMFVQSPRTLDRKQSGLGLGLALVRNLVSLHGGSVSVHSEGKGRGADFGVRLPLSTGRRAAVRAAAPLQPQVVARRVLVVDDNQDAADLLADMLRLAGHDVHVAYDAAHALTLLAQSAVEVGVLDIGLPVMNGYELAREIRGRLAGKECQLIALTGYGQPTDRTVAFAAGFDAFFSKPTPPEELLAEIARGRIASAR